MNSVGISADRFNEKMLQIADALKPLGVFVECEKTVDAEIDLQKNIGMLLSEISKNADTFQKFGDDTEIFFEFEKKKVTKVYIKKEPSNESRKSKGITAYNTGLCRRKDNSIYRCRF